MIWKKKTNALKPLFNGPLGTLFITNNVHSPGAIRSEIRPTRGEISASRKHLFVVSFVKILPTTEMKPIKDEYRV